MERLGGAQDPAACRQCSRSRVGSTALLWWRGSRRGRRRVTPGMWAGPKRKSGSIRVGLCRGLTEIRRAAPWRLEAGPSCVSQPGPGPAMALAPRRRAPARRDPLCWRQLDRDAVGTRGPPGALGGVPPALWGVPPALWAVPAALYGVPAEAVGQGRRVCRRCRLYRRFGTRSTTPPSGPTRTPLPPCLSVYEPTSHPPTRSLSARLGPRKAPPARGPRPFLSRPAAAEGVRTRGSCRQSV